MYEQYMGPAKIAHQRDTADPVAELTAAWKASRATAVTAAASDIVWQCRSLGAASEDPPGTLQPGSAVEFEVGSAAGCTNLRGRPRRRK